MLRILLTFWISKLVFKKNIEIVNLELSRQCNRGCDYCPVNNSSLRYLQDLMDDDLIDRLISELVAIRCENKICLNLYNKPLMDIELESKISRIHYDLPYAHLSFNSNGDPLGCVRLSVLAESGLNFIFITLHPSPGRPFSIKELRSQYENLFRRLDFSVSNSSVETAEPRFVGFSITGVMLKVQCPDWSEIGSNRAQTASSHKSLGFGPGRLPSEKPFREFTVFMMVLFNLVVSASMMTRLLF